MTSAQLRWTGHALIDVGVAGVCVFAGKSRPEDVTLEDLDEVSEFIQTNYFSGALDSYLTVVFTTNSGYCGPNKVDDPEEYADVFRAHRVAPGRNLQPANNVACVFSGVPATAWVHRQHLPLFSAAGVWNYRPGGQVAVPIAASFLVALQFLPMASRKAEGIMLLVHSEAPTLSLRFARRFVEDNKRILTFSMPAAPNLVVDEGLPRERLNYDKTRKKYKTPDVKGPRSLVVSDLTSIGAEASDLEGRISPLTVYLLSNSGQEPSLEVFDVPAGVVAFVLKAAGPTTSGAWMAITRRFRNVKDTAGEVEPQPADTAPIRKKAKKAQISAGPPGRAGWSKNPAFEDLCGIFEDGFLDRGRARAWLSRYVLGRIKSDAAKSRFEDTNARTWTLAELFLKEVLGMKQARIDAVCAFADKLATWIRNKNDKRLYRSLMMEKPGELRRSLMQVQQSSAQGTQLLFGLDEYTKVWLHEDGDEWLIRDLVCIRVVESLAAAGFLGANPELVPEDIERTQRTEVTQ